MRLADLALRLLGSSSGEQIIKTAAATSGAITLPAGTTDFSATGGAGQVVKQTTAGGAFTVAPVAASEVAGLVGLTANALIKGGGAGAAPVASTATLDGSGNLMVAGDLVVSNTVSTGDGKIEIGQGRTGSGNAYLDFHAAAGTDYEFRIIRYSGTDGNTEITQTGVGSFALLAASGVSFTSGGIIVGVPTGGHKGAGTVNAQAVYANNVLLTSDGRLKRDIVPIGDGCLGLVGTIEPKKFKHLGSERVNWGFIAQEVEAAMPRDYGGHEIDAAGNQSLGTADLVACLWKAVQELAARVATLEARGVPAG
jgi:hypothetical protein